MNTKILVKKVCEFIQDISGLPTAPTPINIPIKRPYATVTLITNRPLTQGKSFLNEEGDLMREWQANCTLDVNFYTNRTQRMDEVFAKIANATSYKSYFQIYNVNPFGEVASRFQGEFEKRFTLQINILANLSQVLEREAEYIEQIFVQEELKE